MTAAAEGAGRRMQILMAIIGVGGAAIFTAAEGPPGGIGFATGAAAGYLNYRLLRRAVNRMGEPEKPAGSATSTLFLLRYALIGLLLYVMMKFFGISLMAAIAGLLTPVAATLLAILYELIYART